MGLSKRDQDAFNTIVTRLRAEEPSFAPVKARARRQVAAATAAVVVAMLMMVAATAVQSVVWAAIWFVVAVCAGGRCVRLVPLLRSPSSRPQARVSWVQRMTDRWCRRQDRDT